MDEIIAQYRCAPNFTLVSQSTLTSAKKTILRHDQPHHILLQLVPHKRGAALAVIVIQPLTSSEWPGCVFSAAIREIHCCCKDAGVLKAVDKQIGRTIGRLYTQVTIDTLEVFKTAQVFQLPVACPVPLEFWPKATKEEIAQNYAVTISKKIKSGINEIKKRPKLRDSIVDRISGRTFDHVDIGRRVDSNATYNDIDGYVSKFFVWYSNFNAGALDSIIDNLPRRPVANTETSTRTDKDKAVRKRWRDLARVVNAIVHRLPSRSRIVYIALGIKNYSFTVRHGLSDSQLDFIASWVVHDLAKEDLTILGEQAEICNPVQAISEITGFSDTVVSKAFQDISDQLSQANGHGPGASEREGTGNGEINFPLTVQSGSSCSSSPQASSTCASEYTNECDSIWGISNGMEPPHKRRRLDHQINVGAAMSAQSYKNQTIITNSSTSATSHGPLHASKGQVANQLTVSFPKRHVLIDVPSIAERNQGFFSDCSRVSHSPSPPQALLVSENLFHNIKVYFRNSCRNMILNDHGTLLTPNGALLHNRLCNDFDSYCFTATMLKEKGLHVEFGRALSKASDLVEQILRAEHPRTLACFLEVLIHLRQTGLPEVSSSLRDFIREMSKKVTKKGHPWGEICRLLGELDSEFLDQAMAQAWKCTTDIFDSELGKSSRLAISVRLDYIKRVYGVTDYLEEERLLRDLFSQFRGTSRLPNPRVMLNLAHNLNRQGRHDEAKEMALEVLFLLQEHGIYAGRIAERVESLKIISHSQFNQGKALVAEDTMRTAIRMIMNQWGIQHPWVPEFMNILEGRLRASGKGQDANALRGEIGELMGKDEDVERFNGVQGLLR